MVARCDHPAMPMRTSCRSAIGSSSPFTSPRPAAGSTSAPAAATATASAVDGRLRRAHRVAYAAFVGPIPIDPVVCHRCDNPPCCNPAHLFIGTRRDNNADMRVKGRSAGPGRPHLSDDDVRAIRAYMPGLNAHAAARALGLPYELVWKVRTRRSYAHVQ